MDTREGLKLQSGQTLSTTVKREEEGLMVKDIIFGRLQLTRGLVRRMKRKGGVYLNGKKDFLTRRVRAGDLLLVVFFDEETTVAPQDIPLDVVFEDKYLLVINKPAGMAVHPAGIYQEGTLANAISHYWQTINLKSKVRLVHRIDKDTSGLVLVAKGPYTLQRLLGQLQGGELVREYLALVKGSPSPAAGLIEAPIGRSLDHGIKRAVKSDGKQARTFYETLEARPRASLLRVRLGSGRTHQIRVHFADQGHPLLGDPLYNDTLADIGGQALHAWRLEFSHPHSGGLQKFSSPMPPAMLQLWRKSKGRERD